MSKLICCFISILVLCVAVFQPATAQLQINEIMVNSGNDGSAPNSNEWIELINNSGGVLDIGCTILSDGDFSITIPFGTTLAAGEIYLVGSGGSPDFTTQGIVPDLDWSTCNCAGPTGVMSSIIGSLTNSGEQVLIFDQTGIPTDGVVWGGSDFSGTTLTSLDIAGCPATVLDFPSGIAVTETITIVAGETNAINCSGAYYNDGNATPGAANNDVTPVPNIVASSSLICEGGNVTFTTVQGSLNPTWNIQGTPVNTADPFSQEYSFPSAGTFSATLNVTNSCGDPFSSSISITVEALPALILSSTNPTTATGDYIVCQDANIDLVATLTPAPAAATTVSFEWTQSGVPTPAPVLSSNSTYSIIAATPAEQATYLVNVSVGVCTLPESAINVVVPNPIAEIANFATLDLGVCINEPLLLDALDAMPPADPYEAFSWTNGTVTEPNNMQWTVPTDVAGVFDCALNVSSNGCESAPFNFQISVFDLPVVEILPAGPIDLCPDSQVQLSSLNTHDTYEWYLDNGATPYATTPTLNVGYNLATSAYLVGSNNGCTAQSIPVTFFSHPVATLATWTPPPYAIDNSLRTCLPEHPILASSNGQQFQWYLDGSPLAGEIGLSIIAQQDGNYYYTASIDGFCPLYSDTIAVDVEIEMSIETIASKDTACQGEIVSIVPQGPFVSYSWQGGIEADTLNVTNSGTYIVTGHLVSCSVNDTVSVFFSPYPEVFAGDDFYSDCEDFTLLFGQTDGDDSYWEIGGIEVGMGDTITIETPRNTSDLHFVSSLNGCEARDTVTIKVDCIYIFAPTAITPDGDGLNDVFRVYANGLSAYTLRIFNRYGEVVWETNDPDDVWTGGAPEYYLPNGVYTWQIEALDYNQQEALTKARSRGNITIIR